METEADLSINVPDDTDCTHLERPSKISPSIPRPQILWSYLSRFRGDRSTTGRDIERSTILICCSILSLDAFCAHDGRWKGGNEQSTTSSDIRSAKRECSKCETSVKMDIVDVLSLRLVLISDLYANSLLTGRTKEVG